MDRFAKACHKLITDGHCEGECCGPIPMKRGLLSARKADIQAEYEDIIPGDEQAAFPVAEDIHCIFMDRTTYLCSIYEERPDVCRKFGDEMHPQMCCPYLRADGTKRTRAERRSVRLGVTERQQKLDKHLSKERNDMMAH